MFLDATEKSWRVVVGKKVSGEQSEGIVSLGARPDRE